ncbi:MAG TPA: hypothetical protein VF743_05265, partial [Acidimicrobiales bacterium]
DVESLFVAAAARNHERMEALRGPWEITGTLDERLASFLARRRRIYEEGAQVRRAALVQEPFSPVLQRALGLARLAGRAEIERVFADELAAVAASGRARLRAELEVVSSSASWETLRQHQGHPPDEAEAMVDELVRAVLRAHDLPVPARDKAPPTASPGPPG